jgi:hypothetical protein
MKRPGAKSQVTENRAGEPFEMLGLMPALLDCRFEMLGLMPALPDS